MFNKLCGCQVATMKVALISIYLFIYQAKSQSIFELGRTKRDAKTANFYRFLSKSFTNIYGKPRQEASLGDFDDLPTEILEGAEGYKPQGMFILLKLPKIQPISKFIQYWSALYDSSSAKKIQSEIRSNQIETYPENVP